ncbi:MAG: glycerophosphoryl diester phosphodiesterase membrane domain-containing protein [Elusimicrobiaceae bacterium]|nr:glycerophosphoryl diester phosphodiesterase membrane domain-containing protein [Elusimicrobiaceae bacterium]
MFSLWGYSFKIIARIWWRLLITAIVYFIVGQILTLVLREIVSFLGLGAILGGGRSSGVWFVLIGLTLLAFVVIQTFTCYFWATCIHLFDKAIKQQTPSLMEAFSSSFRPAWSLFIVSFIIFLIALPGTLLARKFLILGLVLNGLLFLLFFIRWTYAQGYIVLQEYGAIDAMRESWYLIRKNYIDTLLLWLIIAISYVVYMGVILITAVLTVKSFSRTTSFYVLGLIAILAIGQLLAFIVVTFVNRDAVENPQLTPQEMDNWTPPMELDFQEKATPVIAQPQTEQNPPTMDRI